MSTDSHERLPKEGDTLKVSPSLTDLEIWQNIKAGDKLSFSLAYDKYVDSLINYGSHFTRDASLVEDCLHDLFVYIWNNRANLSDTDSIKNYMMVSLRRSIINKQKKLSKSQNDISDHDGTFSTELSIEEILINTEITQEKAQQLKKAFEKLSGRQKEAIYLKFYTDQDYDEICEIMDLNYQSARNLVSTGIKKLKDIMIILLFAFLYL